MPCLIKFCVIAVKRFLVITAKCGSYTPIPQSLYKMFWEKVWLMECLFCHFKNFTLFPLVKVDFCQTKVNGGNVEMG